MRILYRNQQGPAGPNSISTNTGTTLTGVLYGDGANMSALATSSGGGGAADAGKVAVFAAGGGINFYSNGSSTNGTAITVGSSAVNGTGLLVNVTPSSTSSYGVYAQNYSDTGTAGYFTSSGTGTAGYFTASATGTGLHARGASGATVLKLEALGAAETLTLAGDGSWSIPATILAGLKSALSYTAADISGSTAAGRALLTAADAAAQRAALACAPVFATDSAVQGVKLPVEFAEPLQGGVTMLSAGADYVREISVVYFAGKYRVIGDLVLTTDTGFPNSYESQLNLWTTTDDVDDWSESSWTDEGVAIAKNQGSHNTYGTATPTTLLKDDKLWVVYSGRGGANGAAPRTLCIASSDDGESFTDHGAIDVSGGQDMDDDPRLVHDPLTGRTYLYGTSFTESPRNPRGWYTDDEDLETATWTKMGVVLSDAGTLLSHAAWFDPESRLFWMIAGTSESLYVSHDGQTFADTGEQIFAVLHAFRIVDRYGRFAGWGTNDSSGSLVYLRRVAKASAWNRVYHILSASSSISASGSVLVTPLMMERKRIRNVRFGTAAGMSASETDYWTFELRSRRSTGTTTSPTISVDTKDGNASYDAYVAEGPFDISEERNLQAFWTKTGSPSNLVFLTLSWEEEPR